MSYWSDPETTQQPRAPREAPTMLSDEQISASCLCTDGLCNGCTAMLDSLAAAKARVARLEAAIADALTEREWCDSQTILRAALFQEAG